MPDISIATADRTTGPSKRLKFLIFQLGCLKYALRILGVNDIVAMNNNDEVQDVSRSVASSVGQAVPVVDLRSQEPAARPDKHSKDSERFFVVVVEAEHARGPMPLGLVVDRCAEILDVSADEVQLSADAKPAPRDSKLGSRTVRILKIEDVLPNVIRLDDHIMQVAAS